MRVIPLSFAPFLSETEVFHHECSDRIWVPRAMFERWLIAEDAGTVVTVRLDDIPACMYAPHREARNIIYAPTWMCEELDVSMDPPMGDSGDAEDSKEDDYIVPERITPPTCTFMRVQPHTSDHLPAIVGGQSGDAMPEDTLSRAFEEYTCIREDQTLTVELPNGNRMFVTIVEAQPQGVGPLCIRNTEIAMDLLEPLDAPAAASTMTVPDVSPAHFTPAVHIPLPPLAAPVQTVSAETREERRERFAKAALSRLTNTTQVV